MEFGETFEDCIVRETLEETGLDLSKENVKYISTVNVKGVDFGYHNVGIYMVSDISFSHTESNH